MPVGGNFINQLEYKADWAGRTISKIDQFFPSSKRCSNCGHTLNFWHLILVRGFVLNVKPHMTVMSMLLKTY